MLIHPEDWEPDETPEPDVKPTRSELSEDQPEPRRVSFTWTRMSSPHRTDEPF